MKRELKSQLEYRLSFILTLISQVGVFFTYYFMTVALFQKFDNIKGFTMYEVLLTFSIIQFGFSMNELFARGIDSFDKLKETGAKAAWLKIQEIDESACINRLMALEGAIQGVKKTMLSDEVKADLKEFYQWHKK